MGIGYCGCFVSCTLCLMVIGLVLDCCGIWFDCVA